MDATKGRIYTPSYIDEIFEGLPGVGRRISIMYVCEFNGTGEGKKRVRTREGIIVQKVRHEHGAYFVVELLGSEKRGNRGNYRTAFQCVDILTGKIKVREVN